MVGAKESIFFNCRPNFFYGVWLKFQAGAALWLPDAAMAGGVSFRCTFRRRSLFVVVFPA
jgi:hypothetical protein